MDVEADQKMRQPKNEAEGRERGWSFEEGHRAPSPADGSVGSAISSRGGARGGARGRAPFENEFGAFLGIFASKNSFG